MVDELKAEDVVEVERIVREIGALVCTPSTIPDIYSLSVYRSAIARRDPMKFWVLLDNNIVTQIVSLISGARKTGVPLSEETKKVCAIMAFLIHAKIDTDPSLALYERPDHVNNPDKVTQDYLFRIADHLPAQVFADLALNRTCVVPVAALTAAKREVDSSPLTQADLKRTTYSDRMKLEQRFKLSHANLLKAWLISHQGGTPTQRLQCFLDWNANELIADYVGFVFAVIFLSDLRIGGMIKRCNSSDRQVVLKAISNSTWDMHYLSVLEVHHMSSKGSSIWFFSSRDGVLLEIAGHRDAVSPDRILAFIREYYSDECVDVVNKYMNQINCRRDRAGHIAKVCANLDTILDGLVKEVLAC
jgi:hypothetical protein